jgi:hypothetical protein
LQEGKEGNKPEAAEERNLSLSLSPSLFPLFSPFAPPPFVRKIPTLLLKNIALTHGILLLERKSFVLR